MSKSNGAKNNKVDKNPAHQTDEANGSVSKAQVTDDTMRGKNTSRGSEPDTRGSSRNRT